MPEPTRARSSRVIAAVLPVTALALLWIGCQQDPATRSGAPPAPPATAPVKVAAAPAAAGASARIIVKLRGALERGMAGAVRPASGTIDLRTARSDARLGTLIARHDVRAVRALVPNRLRMRAALGISDAQIAAATRRRFPVRAARATAMAAVPEFSTTYVLDLGSKPAPAVAQALAALRGDPDVVYAEEDLPVRLDFVPNDTRYGELQGLRNIGLEQAWDTARGAGAVVAIVDSGVDYTHPDIDANIWTNTGEIAGNGVDDDGNGLVDDVRGWDFVGANGASPAPDNDPRDQFGHGTHVAGTVAAEGNNAAGVIGVAFNAKIMPLRVFDDVGSGSASAIISAILYAADEGADVINTSLGMGDSQALRDAIEYAYQHGVLLVGSAGNASEDMRLNFPAANPRAVAVSALTLANERSTFSNFGSKVDLAAPGQDILSLQTNTGDYVSLAGTSMASPHVAGVAALVMGLRPTFTIEQVRQTLRFGATDMGAAGKDPLFGYGRVNAASAVTITQPLEAKFFTPFDGAELRASTPLTGVARGTGFVRYIVEYGAGEAPTTWTTIRNTTTATAAGGGDLGTFAANTLVDGIYTLRLRAIDSTNRTFVDQIQVRVAYLSITSPAPATVPIFFAWRKAGASLQIDGRATGPAFQSFRLEWAPGRNATSGFSAAGVTLTGNGTAPVTDSVLGTWVTPTGVQGEYTLRLTVVNSSLTSQASVTLYLERDLTSANMPFQVGAMTDNAALRARMPDGSTRFIVCTYPNLGNFCTSIALDSPMDQTFVGRMPIWGASAGELDAGAGEEVLIPDDRRLRLTRADFTPVRDIVTTRAETFSADRVSLADVDGDGALEIIALARDTDAGGSTLNSGSLYVYRANGQLFSANYPRPLASAALPNGHVFTDAVAADLNGDGRKEIVVVAGEPGGAFYELQARNADGTPYSAWSSRTIPATLYSLRGAVDLDHDGRSEILVAEIGQTFQVRVVNNDGTTRAGWPAEGLGYRNVAVGDLDRDGREELVGVTAGGAPLQVLRLDGTIVPGTWPTITELGFPVIADINNDGFPEILISESVQTTQGPLTYYDTKLRALSRTGALVREWRLLGMGSQQPYVTAPAVGDFTGDGIVDVAVLTALNQGPGVFSAMASAGFTILSTGSPVNTSGLDWPFVNHDPQNTRSRAVTVAPSLPQPATSPSPAAGATGVATSAQLGWTAGSGATTHDVYFGTTNPPAFRVNQTGTTFNPGTLAASTVYFWRIDEKNAAGTRAGTVWSFTTAAAPSLPQPATGPSPAAGATGVATSAQLGWTAGSGATTHDVYFGTTNPPAFRVNQTGTAFNPGPLAASTVYFWRIDEKNAAGTRAGTVWSFTTAAATTTLFTDNFQSGSASQWTPSGGAWTIVTDGTLAYSQGTNTGDTRSLAGSTAWTNQVLQARVKPTNFNGTNRFVHIFARAQSATSYYYVALRSNNTLELKKLVNGAATTLATANLTVAVGTWYTVKLEVIGTQLRAYVDGTLRASATDTQFASGRIGLGTFNARAVFDDVVVTSQ